MKSKSSHRKRYEKMNLDDLDWELSSLQDELGWLNEDICYNHGIDSPEATKEDEVEFRCEANGGWNVGSPSLKNL